MHPGHFWICMLLLIIVLAMPDGGKLASAIDRNTAAIDAIAVKKELMCK